MFEYFHYYVGIRRLHKKLAAIRRQYTSDVEAERRGDNRGEEIEKIKSFAPHERSEVEKEIRSLHTHYLWQRATRLILPMPSHDDKEMWEDDYGRMMLTTKGTMELRSLI